MTSKGKILFFIFLFFLFVFTGCSTRVLSIPQSETEHRRAIASEDEEINPAYALFEDAEKFYSDGVDFNKKRRWEDARKKFDESLRLLAEIDASEDVILSARIDLLLREIAYDYRFALAHEESLDASAAPIVLSLALERKAMSEDTKKRLAELSHALPKNLYGEFDFPVVWNDRVKEKIIFLQTNVREPFAEWLRRSGRWVPMIKEVLTAYELPNDLAYLPLIESGFANNAYSWAQAVGMWQFIKSTAKIFGLEVNWWLDERRDPEKATVAAAKYFKSLYNKFGNWEVALAAYNCGDGRMKRAIEKQGTNNYWDLDLPSETRDYVPLYMAALIIAKNPPAYGFNIEYYKPYECDIITIDEPINLDIIAQCTDTTTEFIRTLNPEILRYCTPPDITGYALRVPSGKGETFASRFAEIPKEKRTVWAKHKVAKGETLSEIAIHYNTSVSALVEVNNLKSAHKLSIGQELVVPVSPSALKSLTAKGAPPSVVNTSTYRDGNPKKYHIVKSGENLSGIASKYSVSLEELLLANSLGSGSIIKPGMRLEIPVGRNKTVYTVVSGDTPSKIAAKFGVRTDELLAWNELSTESVIFPGQKLTVLAGNAPTTTKTQPKKEVYHTVQKGESLWGIARRYDVRVTDLVAWNKLQSSSAVLSIGQRLLVSKPAPAEAVAQETRTKIEHIVKKGETLGAIAQKYGVKFEDIQSWNNKKGSNLQIGEKLVIYTGTTRAQGDKANTRTVTHTVKSGETLSGIAQKYGITIAELKEQNNKKDNKIIIGEKLTIRTDKPAKEQITHHNVRPGETLTSIAMKYGVSVADLKEWNGKKEDKLLVGEVIEIRGGKTEQTVPSADIYTTVKHTVGAGETLNQIALKYCVAVDDIRRWNELKGDVIFIGQILTIKTTVQSGFKDKTKSTPITHRVEKGETLWTIAQRYNTTTDAIISANGNLDPKKLKIGDTLLIHTGNN